MSRGIHVGMNLAIKRWSSLGICLESDWDPWRDWRNQNVEIWETALLRSLPKK